MRFLWIEDCDGGSSTKDIDIKRWKDYFGIVNDPIFRTLEEVLVFLEKKENWKDFDAVLIDIRFPVCSGGKDNNLEIFKKYFKNIITEERFEEYTQVIGGKKQDASSGILLYLALVLRYNLPQNKIAFVSANIDATDDELSSLNIMKEYLYKAKARETLSEDEMSDFSVKNEELYDLYCEKFEESKERIEEFDFEKEDEIEWYREDEEYFLNLITKLNRIEKELTNEFKDKKNSLKYNSVREEFAKIGLVIPQGFEKPGSENGIIKKSWYFNDWKRTIDDDYSIIRSNIIVICSVCLGMLEKKGDVRDRFIRVYKSILKENISNNEIVCNIDYYLNGIVEALPITYWINSEESLTKIYHKILRDIVSIFDSIDNNISTKCSILKICRNWISHQCINEVNSNELVFIFLLAIESLFDFEVVDDVGRKLCYQSEESLSEIFRKKDKFDLLDLQKNIARIKDEKKRYFMRLEYLVKEFESDSRISNERKRNAKRSFKIPSEDESIMKVLSGIGSEYSSDRKSVRIEDLGKGFIIDLCDSYGYNVITCRDDKKERIMEKIQNWCYSLFIE